MLCHILLGGQRFFGICVVVGCCGTHEVNGFNDDVVGQFGVHVFDIGAEHHDFCVGLVSRHELLADGELMSLTISFRIEGLG